jgi:hypothetical protein
MEVKGTISILEVEAEGTAVAVAVDTSVSHVGSLITGLSIWWRLLWRWLLLFS